MKEIRNCNDGLFRVVEDTITLGAFDTRAQAEWFARTGDTLSAAEAALSQRRYMARIETAKAIIKAVQSLAPINDDAAHLIAEYWDTGNSFTDADLAEIGTTAAHLAACITTLEQAAVFMNGGENTPVAHRATLNAVRRVNT